MANLFRESVKKATGARDFTNIAANFSGQIIAILSSLIFLPIIISVVGVEAYGLIAFYTMLIVASSVFDLGITPALSREISKSFKSSEDLIFIKKYIHSAEMILFLAALVCFGGTFLAADWLALSWLNPEYLTIEEVTMSISIMGLVVGLRIFESAYRGVLIGFHEQVTLNVILSITAVFRWAGSAAVLYFYDSSILLFFVWQAGVSFLVFLALVFYIYYPIRNIKLDAYWSKSAFRSLWFFSGPMSIQAIFILLISQMDKVILSRILTLEEYGYYAIAIIFSTALVQLSAPISQTYFAIFSQNTATKNIDDLRESFHLSTQFTLALIAPVAFFLGVFSEEILTLWSSQPDLAAKVAPLLTLCVIGTFINILTHPLYNLGLAYGKVRIFLKINSIALFFFIPSLLIVTPIYGAVGAALIYIALNVYYIVVEPMVIFRIFPEFDKIRWLTHDVFPPVLGSFIMVSLCWFVMPDFDNSWLEAAYIIIGLGSTLCVTFLTVKKLRLIILNFINHRFFLSSQ
ncbi:oligosaccharide flippase family protein [Gammaproteobacteria bacterium]|nr:oligosaccharide flippase family protein [Gammaproteobacteria bacterium]